MPLEKPSSYSSIRAVVNRKLNRVARKLPAHDFGAVWVVGLCTAEEGEYIYGVANLHAEDGDAPTWVI